MTFIVKALIALPRQKGGRRIWLIQTHFTGLENGLSQEADLEKECVIVK